MTSASKSGSQSTIVSFMTDGYIGNEVEILGAVHERIGSSRIFGSEGSA